MQKSLELILQEMRDKKVKVDRLKNKVDSLEEKFYLKLLE